MWNIGWGPPGQGLWFWCPVVSTLADSFFFGFPAAGLVVAVDYDLSSLGSSVFLMAVTLGCVGASVAA